MTNLAFCLAFFRQKSTNRIDAAGTTHWGSFQADNETWITGATVDVNSQEITKRTIWYPGRGTFTLDTE